MRNFLNFTVLRPYLGGFVTGARNTILSRSAAEIGGIIIGLTLALFILSRRRVVRAPLACTSTSSGDAADLAIVVLLLPVPAGHGIHMGVNQSFYTAFIVFSLNTGAYASEVFRAGIQSIERRTDGGGPARFLVPQAMRFAIVPQAIRRVIPPLLNEFVILIKGHAP